MKKVLSIISVILVLIIIVLVLLTTIPKLLKTTKPSTYYTFEDCMLKSDSKVIEEKPRKCERIDGQIFEEETDRKTGCKTDDDCIFYNNKKGFECCQLECPGPPNQHLDQWEPVNKDWYETEMFNHCGPKESRNCPIFDFSKCPFYAPPLKWTKSVCESSMCIKQSEE